LTQVVILGTLFLIDIFFIYFQYWVGWKVGLIVFLIWFYSIILISWLGLRVWKTDLFWLCLFFTSFFNWTFILFNWALYLFYFLSIKLSQSHDSGCEFCRLTRVCSDLFILLFFNWFFYQFHHARSQYSFFFHLVFLISSFSILLFGNSVS
jgi:hypothetical protein